MRFLKRQTINRRQLKSTTVYSDITDSNVYINPRNSGSMVLPSGTDAQIPSSPINGMMRYNVEHDEVQVFQRGHWRSLRFKESTGITQQNLGAGNSEEIYFGPLNPAPPTLVQSGSSWGGQNLLVIVENVIQLFGQNYIISDVNPTIGAEIYSGVISSLASTGTDTLYFNSALHCTGASGDGATVTLTFSNTYTDQAGNEQTRMSAPFSVGSNIVVTGFTPAGFNGTYAVSACTTSSVSYISSTTDTMTVSGTAVSEDAVYPSTNFVGSIVTGSANLQASTAITNYSIDSNTDAIVRVTIDKTLTGNIGSNTNLTITENTATGSGYYLKFTSPVPYGKIVTVLHGFDQ